MNVSAIVATGRGIAIGVWLLFVLLLWRVLVAGWRSVYALPLRLRDHTIGALNLLDVGTRELEPEDTLAAQARYTPIMPWLP